MAGKEVPAEAILQGYPPGVVDLANRLRAIVKETFPDVEEQGRPGWRLIGYRHPLYFCFIAPQPDHVALGFEWGVHLPDPEGLLEGGDTMKQVRVLRIRKASEIRKRAIQDLLRAAVAYGEFRRGGAGG